MRGVYRTFCGTLRSNYYSSTSRITEKYNPIRSFVLSGQAIAPIYRCCSGYDRYFDMKSEVSGMQSVNQEASSTSKSRNPLPRSLRNRSSERQQVDDSDFKRFVAPKSDVKIASNRYTNRYINA